MVRYKLTMLMIKRVFIYALHVREWCPLSEEGAQGPLIMVLAANGLHYLSQATSPL